MAAQAQRQREVLGDRRLRSLLLGELSNGSGSWAFITVYTFVLYDRTGSAAWITAGLALRWGSALVSGPFAGVLGDRYDRARVMMTSAATSAAIMAALAVCVGLRAPLGVLLVLAVLESVTTSAYGPAFAAALPDVVPERWLATANGMREVVANISIIVGPLLGTAFLVTGEPSLGVGLNAISYLVPLAVVARLHLHSPGGGTGGADGPDGGGIMRDLGAGFTALRAHPTALVLLVAIAFDSGVASLETTLAVPIAVHVGSGAKHYAYLLIAVSLGSVAAAGLAGLLAARTRLAVVLVVSLCAQAVPLALLVVFPHPVPAFLLLFVSGIGMIVVDILAITALQRDTPREFLSRIFGILDTVVLTFVVAFALVAGLLVAGIGLRPVLLIFGLGVTAVVLACTPALVAMDRRTAARTAALEPIVALLRQLDLFDGADQVALERLAGVAVASTVPAGTVLIRQGEAADDLWLLVDGALSVSATGVALPEVTAPGYVGEIGLLHERPRTATVVAASSCQVLRIPGADFTDVLAAGPASRSLLFVTGERMARTEVTRR